MGCVQEWPCHVQHHKPHPLTYLYMWCIQLYRGLQHSCTPATSLVPRPHLFYCNVAMRNYHVIIAGFALQAYARTLQITVRMNQSECICNAVANSVRCTSSLRWEIWNTTCRDMYVGVVCGVGHGRSWTHPHPLPCPHTFSPVHPYIFFNFFKKILCLFVYFLVTFGHQVLNANLSSVPTTCILIHFNRLIVYLVLFSIPLQAHSQNQRKLSQKAVAMASLQHWTVLLPQLPRRSI